MIQPLRQSFKGGVDNNQIFISILQLYMSNQQIHP